MLSIDFNRFPVKTFANSLLSLFVSIAHLPSFFIQSTVSSVEYSSVVVVSKAAIISSSRIFSKYSSDTSSPLKDASIALTK